MPSKKEIKPLAPTDTATPSASVSTPPPTPSGAAPESKVIDVPPTEPEALSGAPESVTAEELVSKDNDAFPPDADSPQPGVDPSPVKAGDAPTPPLTEAEKSGAGRPPLPPSGDPKLDARRARDRDRKRTDKTQRPAPDFSDVKNRTGETLPGAAAGQPAQPGAVPVASSGPKSVDYKALSEMAFGLTTGVACNFFGPEWAPRDEKEKDSVTVPLATWMASKNLPDLPIGAILLLSIAMYSAPRFRAPTTREKAKGIWTWVKGKFSRKKKANTVHHVEKVEPEGGRN